MRACVRVKVELLAEQVNDVVHKGKAVVKVSVVKVASVAVMAAARVVETSALMDLQQSRPEKNPAHSITQVTRQSWWWQLWEARTLCR